MTDASASASAKRELRRAVRARRADRSAAERDNLSRQATNRLLTVLNDIEISRVAVFLSTPGELDTRPLIETLGNRQPPVTVYAPHALASGQMTWSRVTGTTPIMSHASSGGVPEPDTAPSERLAQVRVDAIVCPAAMVDARGNRLGWGKGYYDRFLATVPATTPVIALVFDDEFVDALPSEPHDRPVTHVVTPSAAHLVG